MTLSSNLPYDPDNDAGFRRGFAHGAQDVIDAVAVHLTDAQVTRLKEWMASDIRNWAAATEAFVAPPPVPRL